MIDWASVVSLLSPAPVALSFSELPGAISARELNEHYKLYLGYRDMLGRVDGALPSAPLPSKHVPEGQLAGLLWGQGYALAGAFLHERYFENLTAVTIRPRILLSIEAIIERQWGSKEAFITDMIAAGLQARGWVLLGVSVTCPTDLRILTMNAHDTGAVFGYCPVLVIDVYEHAWWLDFGTDKAGYLKAILGYINWPAVDARHREVHPDGSRLFR